MVEHPIAGVLVYLRELEPLVVGGALDCWQPQELVGVGVVVVVEVVEVVDAVPPVEDQDEDDHDDPPRYLGRHPDPHNKAPLEAPGPREDRLEPWASGFTTTCTYVDARSRTIRSRTGNCECHPDQ